MFSVRGNQNKFIYYGSGLGVHRWVVYSAIALLCRFWRVCICREVRDDIHVAFSPVSSAASSAGADSRPTYSVRNSVRNPKLGIQRRTTHTQLTSRDSSFAPLPKDRR